MRRLWRYFKWVAVLAYLAVLGCGEPIEGQEEATEIVAYTYRQYGLHDPRPLKVVWYFQTECIKGPFDPEHDTRCRRGRSIVLGVFCQVEVVWRGNAISDTSFAHELMHCAQKGIDDWGDRNHSSHHWTTTLPLANERLRNVDL